MARQWIAREWGTPDRWEFIDTEVPAPGQGEVTIEVRAAGVNPADAKHVAAARAGVTLPVPIGYEVSGVITAIGPDTLIGSGQVALGDEVLAFRVQGGYATSLTVPAEKVFAKPASITHEQAANLLLAGTTAAEMLHVTGARAGETVLLHGASGAVGVAVLQLARMQGVHVVGTASAARAELVRSFGGIPVAYGDGLLERMRTAAPTPIAAALDAAGTAEALDVSLALVPDRERIVTIVDHDRAAREGVRSIAGAKPASAVFRDGVRAELIAMAAAGELQVPTSRTYPLAQAREAVAFVLAGHPGGKVSLVP